MPLLCVFATTAHTQNTISTDSVLQTSFCAGGFVIVPFTVTGNWQFGTTFYAEMSDAQGNFGANPDTIGEIPFLLGNQGIVPGQFPDDVQFGFLYRIRVVADTVTGSQSPNTVIITQINFLANITALTLTTQCTGTDVTLVAGIGVGGSTYAWNTGDSTSIITVNQPGIYTLTVTDIAGCEVESDPYELQMYPTPAKPTISIGVQNTLFSSTGEGYQWYHNGSAIGGATAQAYDPTMSGSYHVTHTNSDGCESKPSDPVHIHNGVNGSFGNVNFPEPPQPTNMDPPIIGFQSAVDTSGPPIVLPDLDVYVWPNPTDDFVNIRSETDRNEKAFYIVYDMKGREVMRSDKTRLQAGETWNATVDLTAAARGLYSLQVFVHGRLWDYKIFRTD